MARNKLTDFDRLIRHQISQNLKKLTLGITQAQLSDKTGIPISTLSGYFAERSTPAPGTIQKIADAIGVNKSDIDPRFKTSFEESNIVPLKRKHRENTYNYFDAGLSAGALMNVDPFTSDDVEKIVLSDVIMGKYAGDKNIFISYINGESMNRIIPDGSLIAIKRYDDVSELCNGDIVVFQDQGEMAVKRFYNDRHNGIITFSPDSTDDKFTPINYLYSNLDNVRIVGKVVVYTVTV